MEKKNPAKSANIKPQNTHDAPALLYIIFPHYLFFFTFNTGFWTSEQVHLYTNQA